MALVSFADSLDAEELARVCEYRDSKGDPYARPVWQILTHVVTHGAQHRAEAGILLAQHGRSPGDIDFIYFCRDVLDK